jgi:DNA-binding transcriptional MerR regulator
MMRVNGRDYLTISDAAGKLGVNVRTVREWLRKSILPPPNTVEHGLREIQVFSEDYLREALLILKRQRAQRRRKA